MRPLYYILALAIIIPAGIAQGLWTGRWSTPEDYDSRVAALGRIPLRFGHWEGSDLLREPKDLERAGLAGGLMRLYQDGRGGRITVLLVCGRPGPTSVHTPEICYAGAGYEPVSPRRHFAPPDLGGPAAEFWEADFSKQGATVPDYLRIFYGWSVDGTWHAPANPRLDFAGSAVLYKLYIIHPLSNIPGPGDDLVASFAREFLPEVGKALHTAP